MAESARAAVSGSGFVVVEIGQKRARRHLVGHELVQHDDVRLLQHLCGGRAVATEQEGRRRWPSWRDVGDDERLEPEEAGELFVQPAHRVVAVDERVGNCEPRRALLGILDKLGAAPQVPARHDVRERVVVDGLVVLVRADDAVKMRAAVDDANARGPVTRGFDEQLARRTSGELLITGPVDVGGGRPDDVCRDVLFRLTGADARDLARR